MADEYNSNNNEEAPDLPAIVLEQHPLVSRLRPNPARPAHAVTELIGLPGHSTRPGYQRLYLTLALDYYAEFSAEDMLYSASLRPDTSPFPGHEAVVVSVRREATIDYTWTKKFQPADEFDLDLKLESTIGEGSGMYALSGFTSCAPCYSMGISCTLCPSRRPCPH